MKRLLQISIILLCLLSFQLDPPPALRLPLHVDQTRNYSPGTNESVPIFVRSSQSIELFFFLRGLPPLQQLQNDAATVKDFHSVGLELPDNDGPDSNTHISAAQHTISSSEITCIYREI